ncbi:SRPBCC family protein [Streptomyces sp. H10-C2]|uniref:SRPBCC family protein n=1 Tax=unclassified Streptomyces TaxID=2593676 RepID=UPI0024BA246D|nr:MULTISPECIES: SRPBCC family protein [unclassified Streptomyces]MDJ0347334.1 SRPBCC family protein [Streptomyces sp. PH10-H1]MDJ0375073.1 SRPBCC family protein [Streptomyces sp. H10-C2]
MTRQPSARFVAAPPERIRQFLRTPLQMPEWNPAFLSIGGPASARVGDRHTLTVHGGLRGTWEYTRIEQQRIDATWQVPGLVEDAVWQLRSVGRGTIVTHEFRQRGSLARLLAGAFRGVVELRLDRLADLAGHADQTGQADKDDAPAPRAASAVG